jgi:PAS domain S-box-containing protein
LVVGLATGGYHIISSRRAEARKVAHEELRAIADLKLKQIVNWREERLSDARFFSRAQFVAQDIERFLAAPENPSYRAALLHTVHLLKAGERYSAVVVYDPDLRPRLAVPEPADEPAESLKAMVSSMQASRGTVLTDLHRDATGGSTHLNLMLPIYRDPIKAEGSPIAMLLLKLDADHFLFPLLQTWPTSSQTAETLLVRQEGDEVLYLNELRHLRGTALSLRKPMASTNLVAARVLRGETQAVEGTDYRGIPVVAAGSRVPETSWALIAKIDQEEVFVPVRRQTRMSILMLSSWSVAAALLLGLVWRQRRAQYLQRELALAERVGHLMRHANDSILLVSQDGRLLEANDCAAAAYGYSPEELSHRNIRDLRTPESLAQLQQDLHRASEQLSVRFETIHQRKDGTPFPVEVSTSKIRVEGEYVFLSIIRDISERKAYEREIQRLNRLYAALSHINQAVVRANSREALLQEACRILVDQAGFPMAYIRWPHGERRELMLAARAGEPNDYFSAALVSTDIAAPDQCPTVKAVLEGHACVYNELPEQPSPASWQAAALQAGWHSAAAFLIAETGEDRGALAVFSDQPRFFSPKEEELLANVAGDVAFGLRSLRQAEERRHALEQVRLQAAALQSAANAIVITDRTGLILWVNTAFEQLTGYTLTEVRGRSTRMLKSDRQSPTFFREMWDIILTGGSWRGELVNRRKDGRLYDEEMTITPVTNAEGEVTHFIAIKQDISERKRAEAELVAARDKLEETVAERTVQLVEANTNLQTFAYTAAHDLRSPLRSIKAFTGFALEEYGAALGDTGRSYLQRVAQSADQMERLLTDLLEYSKLSQTELKLEPVALNQAVNEALAMLEADILALRAEIQVEGNLPAVRGHPATVVLILTNFISNALKFTARGVPPQIRIRAEQTSTFVRVWVSDNGIGITPEQLHRLFQVFQRLHSKQTYPGTGLGLAIVRKGAERMGGRVGVESDYGRGSRFWIELPSATPEG